MFWSDMQTEAIACYQKQWPKHNLSLVSKRIWAFPTSTDLFCKTFWSDWLKRARILCSHGCICKILVSPGSQHRLCEPSSAFRKSEEALLLGQFKGSIQRLTPKCWSDNMQLERFLLSLTKIPCGRGSFRLYHPSPCCVEKGIIEMSDWSVISMRQVSWISTGSGPFHSKFDILFIMDF